MNRGIPIFILHPSSFIPHPSYIAWLALDDDDNDPLRFLTYCIAALATLKPGMGDTAIALLQSPQPPPPKAVLTTFINELSALAFPFALVLDDYHVITAPVLAVYHMHSQKYYQNLSGNGIQCSAQVQLKTD